MKVPFNRMHPVGRELEYLMQATQSSQLGGTGPFGKKCEALLAQYIGGHALLLPSGTAALELGTILLNIGPGDEVIMPSFTFPSTANAVRLLGGKVVFCDVAPGSMNIDVAQIEGLITDDTKAIYPIDYAGAGCDIETIQNICQRHGLACVEDAAQAIGATRDGKPVGSMAALSAFSFHESKNLGCGEGGSLVINDETLIERAHILRDKGTNRRAFNDGLVDKYTWVDTGSSYVISELNAAYLLGQLECLQNITDRRLEIWNRYAERLAPLREMGCVSWNDPIDGHNAHIFSLFLESEKQRNEFIAAMRKAGVQTFFHYQPLHTSPMGLELGYALGDLPVTETYAARLVRLPLFYSLSDEAVDYIIEKVFQFWSHGDLR